VDGWGYDLFAGNLLPNELGQLLGVVVVVLGKIELLGRRGFSSSAPTGAVGTLSLNAAGFVTWFSYSRDR
jgi:hypothetical protein